MAGRFLRNGVALAVSLLLTFTVAATALAVTYWSSGCANGTGTYVCVWRDNDFQGPYGHWGGGDYSYVGQYYPGTSQTVNDSVTSLQNHYAANDVIWWPDPNFGGVGLCVDSNSSEANLWWGGLNDTFSSHQLMVNDGYC